MLHVHYFNMSALTVDVSTVHAVILKIDAQVAGHQSHVLLQFTYELFHVRIESNDHVNEVAWGMRFVCIPKRFHYFL